MNDIDDLLAQMRHDNQIIDQRKQEREAKYRQAIESYRTSIRHEQEAMARTKNKYEERNANIKNDIIHLYRKY